MNQHRVAQGRTAAPALLVIGILLIAANLRAPITGIAPVIDLIQERFALSKSQAGLLTTLPLLAFAALSPFSVRLARRYGLERSLLGALALIAAGIALRSLDAAWCLFLGTWIIGSGIAVGNVLLPSLLKRDFPASIAAMTGAYAVTMAIGAATASAIVVPLTGISGFGWPGALAATIVLPLVTIVFWTPQLAGRTSRAGGTAMPPQGGRIWRSALAWQVTLFMGLNSFLYYIVVGWLPVILAEAGYSAAEAGSLHGVLQLACGVPGLLLAPLVSRMHDQRAIAAGVSLLVAVGFAGFLVLPAWATVWSVCLGIGCGSTVILSLMFMSLRATSPQQAAALSGMAQCVGYLLAASGPPLAGALHDLSDGWSLPLAGCLALSLAMAAIGMLAGRDRHVTPAPHTVEAG